MRVGLMTREYPPYVYGGAGVHVEYLSRELAEKIEVEVHAWGEAPAPDQLPGSTEPPPPNLEVQFAQPWPAITNGTRADILKAYPDVDPGRIHVIYNGIDLQQYQWTPDTSALTKYGVDPAKPYVLFVGRITRQKGVTHLVDAIPHLPPGTQVVLCAGAPDTPEIAAEMRDKVEAVRRQTPLSQPAAVENFTPPGQEPAGHSLATGDPLGVGHNIVWIEQMVTKEEAIQLYSHCAVFCCPSVYEPFGIINLEAMACRAPVVASATGGILEVVVEGETGHLVPFSADPETTFPDDPARFSRDLAAKVTALLEDPGKAKTMGEAGRRRVEEHFSWTRIADQTIELYSRLTEARS